MNNSMDNKTFENLKKEIKRTLGINSGNAYIEDAVGAFLAAYVTQLDTLLDEKGHLTISKEELRRYLNQAQKDYGENNVVSFSSDNSYRDDENGPAYITEDHLADTSTPDNLSPEIQLERQEEERKQTDSSALESLKRICEDLDEKTKNRLFVICLKFKNTLETLATRPPSEWPPELKQKFNQKYPENIKSYQFGKERSAEEKQKQQEVHNARPDYEKKLRFLRQETEAACALFACIQQIFHKELTPSSKRQAQQFYACYYERAQFTARPSRDKQTLLEKFKPIFAARWAEAEKAFGYVSITKELRETGPKALTERDQAILPALNLHPCRPEYLEAIQLSVFWECDPAYRTDARRTLIGDFAPHLTTCKQCRAEYEKFKRALQARLAILKAISETRGLKNPFPKHIYSQEGLEETQINDCVAYYENKCRQLPGPLNRYFLQTARTLSGKTKTDKMIQTQTPTDILQAPSMLGLDYNLSVRCICGREDTYSLNHLRPINKVILGRQQKDGILPAAINVCPDDKNHISREMCQFEYDEAQNDWFLSACGQNKEQCAQKGSRIGYISFVKLREVLEAQLRKTAAGGKIQCKNIWERAFTPLNAQRVPLRDIAGIGLLWLKDGNSLHIMQREMTGTEHPLLGKLPFGWYIEVAARASQQVVRSFLAQTKNPPTDISDEPLQAVPVDNPTIVE